MKLPTSYCPSKPEEFLGSAKLVAQMIDQLILDAEENDRSPIKLLLLGPPGTAKSTLAKYAFTKLQINERWSLTKLNGGQVGVEMCDQVSKTLGTSDLFGRWRGIQVEEVDQITVRAQVRFLTMLDDLPKGNAIICTSNCALKDLEDRFQSRWKVFQVDGVPVNEIVTLLKSYGLSDKVAMQIANGSNGNVRMALLDAEQALQYQAMRANQKKATTP